MATKNVTQNEEVKTTLPDSTALPISTGVSGLAANVATFLATPSSSNLASAVTDETGSGALVFATSPTLVTPVLGVATATSVSANTAEDADSATDDVLVTTIPNTVYGMLIVRESAGTEACIYLLAGGTIEKVSGDATFTVTKDNAATYNVYFEDNVIKIQNKVGVSKNIRCGLFGV